MAQKLLRYYKYINKTLGTQGKIELAKMTKIPSMFASTEPDSEKNITTFKNAVEKITNLTAPEF
ncbi:MAG: hypothetical protein A2068_00380 [Ignavibacteria bacterium GWB2_35_6b]|nr:MAG: hypothetical protein A2068_00380 [Ignavibacteria bacterium GWB2_35_6b]